MMELENQSLVGQVLGGSADLCPMAKHSVSTGPSYIPRAASQWTYNYLLQMV